MVGGIVGGILPLWINMGSYTIDVHEKTLPTFLKGCATSNTTLLTSNFTNTVQYDTVTGFNSTWTTAITDNHHESQLVLSWLSSNSLTLIFIKKQNIQEKNILFFRSFLENLYSLSHMWINPFSLFISFILGILISLVTGMISMNKFFIFLIFLI